MTQETKMILVKRAKSLGWRVGMFAVVSLLAFLSDNLSLFSLSAGQVTVLSLVLSEVTKYLNTKQG